MLSPKRDEYNGQVTSTEPPLVYRVDTFGDPDAANVAFVFCPFGVPNWQMALPGLPIWHLRRKGYYVISYSYALTIITVSAELTMANFEAIMADAKARLSQVSPHARVITFGSSMGTVLAMNFAAASPRVHKLILNLCYFNIAEHILNLSPMPKLSSAQLQAYVRTAGGPAGLHRIFDSYSPDHLTSAMKGRDVLLFLSRNDRILKFRHTAKLRGRLESAGARVTYYESGGLGHYFAALTNHVKAARYMGFLAR